MPPEGTRAPPWGGPGAAPGLFAVHPPTLMNQQILSQDEVDALLQGITGESQKLEEEQVEIGAVRTYDLTSQERIVRGRMPTMEIINERFARNVRLGVFNLIRKTPEISIGSTKVLKFSSFLREIVVPTNFNIMSVRPLRGSGLIVCDPTLVFAVIDALFGGAGKYHTRIEGRDFSLDRKSTRLNSSHGMSSRMPSSA